MYKRIALNGLAILALVTAAGAAQAAIPGFYIGAGIGSGTIEVDDPDFDFDENDTAFKLFGGYSFTPNWAVELAYFDGGEPTANFGGGGSVEVATTGVIGSLVGSIPVSEGFSLFGKIGFASYEADIRGRIGNTTIAADSVSEDDLAYGVGLAVNLGDNFQLRGEYEAIDVDDGNFNTISLSGLFRF